MSTELLPPHPYLETNNPQHFINLVPENVRAAIYQIPYEWFEWDEPEIIIKVFNGNIPDTDAIYRLNFWQAYEEKFESEKPLTTKDITGGGSSGYLNKSILSNPGRTLYLITEPTKVKSQIRYTQSLAMKSMVETLKLPVLYNSKTGLPDAQLLQVKQKIFEYIDQRLHGSIIQRQEIKQQSQNLNVNIEATPKEIDSTNLEALDKKIKELELELSKAPEVLPPAIEVMPEELNNVKTVLPQSLRLKE